MLLQRMSHKILPFPLSLFKSELKGKKKRNSSTPCTSLNPNQEIIPCKLAFHLFLILIFLDMSV